MEKKYWEKKVNLLKKEKDTLELVLTSPVALLSVANYFTMFPAFI